MRTSHLASFATLALLTFGGRASASDFHIEPTRLDLAGPRATAQLTVTNRGRAAVRFQAKAFAWSQSEHGVMQLAPAAELVIYPTVFALGPGARRVIRVATTKHATVVERSYRIFVEELPPPRVVRTTMAVVVLTRIGVPIFVAPQITRVRGDISGTVHGRMARFSIANRSTVHVKVAKIRTRGLGRAGNVVFDHHEASWYVLAGTARTYTRELGASCALVERLAIDAVTDRGTWSTTLAVAPGLCKVGK